MKRKQLISIITPVYNEEEAINPYYEKLTSVLKDLENIYDFEIIFTDNNSGDETFSILEKLAKNDRRISVYRFSKNYGYQKSIWLGYSKCSGDAAIELDADLQDPPELISKMLELREKGYKIIYGIRKDRKESVFMKSLRKIFYRLVRVMSNYDIPNDTGDFMLIDRVIIDNLKLSKIASPYLRGTIFSFGYSRIGFNYKRDARQSGESKFPSIKLFNLASDAIINTTILPLRIATFLGLLIATIAILLALIFIFEKIFLGNNLPGGSTAVLVILLFSISLNAILIGIVGEYVGRIYTQLTSSDILPIIEKQITNNKPEIDNK